MSVQDFGEVRDEVGDGTAVVNDQAENDADDQMRVDDQIELKQINEENISHRRSRKMTEKGKDYKMASLLQNRTRTVTRLKRKLNAIDRLLFSSANMNTVKEELDQFNDLFKLVVQYHNEYVGLLHLDDQNVEEDWFDELDQDVCDFKHKVISWLREVEDRKSKGSSKGSSKSKKSSSKSSHSSNSSSSASSTKQKLLEEKAKIAELEAEARFEMERQRAENQAKMLQIQKDVARAKARAMVYEEEENKKIDLLSERGNEDLLNDERMNINKRKNTFMLTQEHHNYLNRNKEQKDVLLKKEEQKLPDTRTQRDHLANDELEHRSWMSGEKNDNKMIDIMSKLLRQQSAPEVEIDTFTGNPIDYHYFIAAFEEVVERKIDDPRGRLTRLIKYTDGEPKEMIKHFIQQPAATGYKNARYLLEEKYGNPHCILSSYRKEIKSWPQLKPGDGVGYRKFYNFLLKCESATFGQNWNALDTPEMMCLILSKLPGHTRDRWNRIVMSIRRKHSREPDLADIIHFVDDEATLVNDPLFSKEALSGYIERKEVPTRRKQMKIYGTGARENKQLSRTECELCKKNHDLDSCEEFLKKAVEERSKFLWKSRLCYGCYKPVTADHNARTCTQRRKCAVCNESHPTGLHGYKPNRKKQPSKESKPSEEDHLTVATTKMQSKAVSMSIVPVRIKHPKSKKEVKTYAMLDCCSQGTFVHEDLMKTLNIKGMKAEICIQTLNGEGTEKSDAVTGLKVAKSSGERIWIDLPVAYTRNELPIGKDDVVTPRKIKCWKYLNKISNEINQEEDIEIGILIGGNCSKALEPVEVIPGENGGPYAFRTVLGWCIVGAIDKVAGDSKLGCNRIAVKDVVSEEISQHYFALETKFKDTSIEKMLHKMYRSDFNDNGASNDQISEISIEDKKFLKLMEKECSREGKHYKLPLPLKIPEEQFPDNRWMAEKRLYNLKKKFQRDKKYKEDYINFMNNIIEKGYAKRLDRNLNGQGRTWFIPHHGVYHPSKPEKIRVVFDCSAEVDGVSVNKRLMTGPDMTNQITGVLVQFREEPVAVIADIEAMFYQVFVAEEHRGLLSFLWWENGNFNEDPQHYEMCVHVFGGASSPSCSNYALKRTARDNEQRYGSEVADIIRKNFYVDDMLKSFKDEKTAIQLVTGVKAMCAEGGFHLKKFVSNSIKVLSAIPEEDRRKGHTEQDLLLGTSPTEKALGIYWNIKDDKLGFDVVFKEKPETKRGMLSLVSSIYDPLGFVSPFVLEGKQIMQMLCYSKYGWDEPVNDEIKQRWSRWKNKINLLKDIKIDRCYKPRGFGRVISCSLHYFSDASECGYGQATYIRLVDDTGRIHCSLVMAKSRVTPAKFNSIPRLELVAAVLSVQISVLIKKEFNFSNIAEYFWTDSQVVLGYLANTKKRFKIFVANRIEQVRACTDISQWNYVTSKSNPADLASRGMSGIKKEQLKLWFSGPEFLWRSEFQWPKKKTSYEVDENDPEVKIEKVQVNMVKVESTLLDTFESSFSSWTKMIRVMAWIIKFKKMILSKIKREHTTADNNFEGKGLCVSLISEAQKEIIKMSQANAFKEEIEFLKKDQNSKPVKRKSGIYNLDPFLDDEGLLRVGGRLKKSFLNFNEVHPLLLDKSSIVTKLIVDWCHQKTAHGGRGLTMNEVRSNGFWVVNCNKVVRSLIGKCVRCRMLRGKFGKQKMADLPNDRTVDVPPFTNCGVDMFGPFLIKEGRKELKRYGAIFTCLSSRAAHIESTCSMDTDSFIQALRRFIARRGNIRVLRCDNGSNFVGAQKELVKAFNEMDHEKIKFFLETVGADWIVWKRNPPGSSHMGGVWERQIRSIRNILMSLLITHGRSLNDEGLRTLFAETEAILNSRPLTTETLGDVNSEQPICPSNLLTMKSKVILPPPGQFVKADEFSRRRWRRIQHIANEFWVRWRKEYLSSLQCRQKWNSVKRNFEPGDIVLLKTEANRNQWPLAKVIGTNTDGEGNVRSVRLLVGKSRENGNTRVLERPIQKIVLLKENEVRFPDEEKMCQDGAAS